jgi:integrase
MLQPVRPDVGAAVSAPRADHASPHRPDNGVVGQVIGIHCGLVIAGDRIAIDEQIPDAITAEMAQRDLAQNRSGGEIGRLLRRELGRSWSGRSIHEITKRDVVEVISAVEQRGALGAANKTLKSTKTFLRWCVGRAILDRSPAEGIPLPTKVTTRDKVLTDQELAQVIRAARKIGGPYGSIVEFLALTGQRREEVAQMAWDELDIRQRVWPPWPC